jgi:hypothetical protein
VDLLFVDRDLCALCNNAAATAGRWSEDRAQIIRQRLYEVEGVPSLADLDALPYVRITARDDGCFAVSAGDELDLVLRPALDSGDGHGPVEWTKVTAVTLTAVTKRGHDE